MLLCQQFAALHQRVQQRIQRCIALQGTQILRVRTADVDGDVIGPGVDAIQPGQIVVSRLFDRCAGILADIQTQQALAGDRAGALHVADKGIQAMVVEAHAVDQGLGRRQAEHARFGVARLALGRDGADLDKAETHGFPGGNAFGVLVQAGGQSDTVRKTQAAQCDRIIHKGLGKGAAQRRVLQARQGADGEFMRCFSIHAEQGRARQGVGNQCHGRTIMCRWCDPRDRILPLSQIHGRKPA